MLEMVIRDSSLAFSQGSLIFLPELVVQGSSLAFSQGGHFELSYVPLSFSALTQMLVTGLGPDHAYSIGFGPGSQ